jgi:tetratricopeptide (TPR) repeat protein
LSGEPDYPALARAAAEEAQARPLDPGVLLHAAEMHLRAGEPEAAAGFARQAVAAAPASFRARRTLSGILDATGQRAEAIDAALQAVRLDPAEPEARLHLGGMLAAERRWREAAEHLAAHVAGPAATPRGWRLLSSVLHQAGQADRALDAAQRAIAADPNEIEYRLHLVSLLTARARYAQALEEVATALAQAPGEAQAWRARSGVLAATDRLAEALAAAERAAELAPEDQACAANLAHVRALCAIPAGQTGEPSEWAVRPRRTGPVRPARQPPGFAGALTERWRVVHAIMLRDIRTKFGHTRLGYLWAVMEPISHLLTLGAVFFTLNSSPPPLGDNLFLYYVTGLVPFLMFSHVSHDVMNAAEANGVMLQLPVVKRTDVMAAQALRQFATEIVVGLVIFGCGGLLGLATLPADLLTAGCGIVLLWLLATGIGACNLVIAGCLRSYETFYAAAVRLLYFSSGIYYSPMTMPDWVREILAWNPVLQGIELFRSGYYAQYDPHWLDVRYLLAWILCSLLLGFSAERALRPRVLVVS